MGMLGGFVVAGCCRVACRSFRGIVATLRLMAHFPCQTKGGAPGLQHFCVVDSRQCFRYPL